MGARVMFERNAMLVHGVINRGNECQVVLYSFTSARRAVSYLAIFAAEIDTSYHGREI